MEIDPQRQNLFLRFDLISAVALSGTISSKLDPPGYAVDPINQGTFVSGASSRVPKVV